MSLFLEAVIVSIIGGVITFFWILSDLGENSSDSVFYLRLFPAGIVLLLAVTIGNSFVENKWTTDYILDFLGLKNVGEWFFRMAAFLSYICIFWGFIVSLALLIKKFRKDR